QREPVSLDVTETSIASQHFDARDNELLQDNGWGAWINRLNAALRWGRWTAGVRLDSSVYWRRPVDNPDFASLPLGGESGQGALLFDNVSRFQNTIYPAKFWATYAAPGLEVTAGDAYVQFGRGLTLSMRKIDELGIDTTVRGAKVSWQNDPFAATFVAGFGNPTRIDDATGRSLFLRTPEQSLQLGVAPVFGSDRVIGVDLQAGRGLPLTFSTHVVRFTRCAPYHFGANGIETSFFDDPGGVAFGSCDDSDIAQWLGPLPSTALLIKANDVTMVGESMEVPTLGGHGKLYVEVAGQQDHFKTLPQNFEPAGNAVYAALSTDFDPVTTTLEIKSNRNFYPMAASVDLSHALEFQVVAYAFTPPAETPTILDTEFGYFNACVDGGRLRTDVKANDDVLLYGQGIYAYTKTEQNNGGCDSAGHTVPIAPVPAATVQDTVWDGLGGLEWYSHDRFSHVFASAGVRDDTLANGNFNYREHHLEYSVVNYLGHAVSLEVQGFHRNRREDPQNPKLIGGVEVPQWWFEGENYVALKVAPKWVFAQGFEYTTLLYQPLLYFNGAVTYKFTSGSNVRLFVGQQRGAFRCAAGVCRQFPPFEGARAELTLRF
ncbi:MAG TPA: hypothetical protein VKU41_01065, partial [Polyangiaceae bacterium]|nr:hypothetical protein [Polyangiaceae bacterium]